MDYKTLLVAHDGNIATITLNRPDKRNAISYELIEELLAALDELANSSAARADSHGSRKSILLGHGPGQSEGARGPLGGAEPERL